ncbi:MAG: D-beta-D-heptose 1-phosphate adenylyltransferase [Gammaproteobacteria bacterium]|nr:D-beta-D-heptose 1-phosphate adenylyltransferase [Gammaproteobacteria bacterium]
MVDEKIVRDRSELQNILEGLTKPIVFTNGCFDILHRGHVTYLARAAAFGRSLVVGVNTDASVKRLDKSPDRPVNCLEDRMAVLAALESVDIVVPFDEDTPEQLINLVEPDHLVKGGDWSIDEIAGGEAVKYRGGQIHSIPFEYDCSTTELIERIRSR